MPLLCQLLAAPFPEARFEKVAGPFQSPFLASAREAWTFNVADASETLAGGGGGGGAVGAPWPRVGAIRGSEEPKQRTLSGRITRNGTWK